MRCQHLAPLLPASPSGRSRSHLSTQFCKSMTEAEARHMLGGRQLPDRRSEAPKSRVRRGQPLLCGTIPVTRKSQEPIRVTQVRAQPELWLSASGHSSPERTEHLLCVWLRQAGTPPVLSPGQVHSPLHAPASIPPPSTVGAHMQMSFLPGCTPHSAPVPIPAQCLAWAGLRAGAE